MTAINTKEHRRKKIVVVVESGGFSAHPIWKEILSILDDDRVGEIVIKIGGR